MAQYERTPLNAEGDFYVEKDMCMLCAAPYEEARELMEIEYPGDGCYFKRQPSTPEEIENAINAVWASCIEAVRYAGSDPEIINKIRRRGCASQIDQMNENPDPER